MNGKKWVIAGALVSVVAVIAVWASVPPSARFRVFRTTAVAVTVSQSSVDGIPRYQYGAAIGSNLVALALGGEPTSNQVLALAINCDTTLANLIVFDKTDPSNRVVIATSTSFDKVIQASLTNSLHTTSRTNQERFVAQFNVGPVGNLAGGFLTMAGRLNLDTDGCVKAILVAIDRDAHDRAIGDIDVPDLDPDRKDRRDIDLIVRRAGRAHFIGVMDVVSGAETNAVLIPSGHLTLRRQLDEFAD